MTRIFRIITMLSLAVLSCSCAGDFLQKPMGSDVTAKDVFSSKQKAMSAIAQAYSDALRINITFLENDGSNTYGMTSGTLAHISGELNGFRYNWSTPVIISLSGMSVSNSAQIDNFGFNYDAIRHCYTVIANIDNVPDMSESEKENVKGEMYALIAYRYCRMLIQYGGVPIVDRIEEIGSSGIPRSSVKEVLEHIVDLCDNYAFPKLPDVQPADMDGRLTKGAALAIKAQAYLYCARPLFNTDKPYLSLGGENDKLICMGEPYNEDLWQKARDAAQAVITWAEGPGGKHIVNTGNPFDDYGMAVSPGSPEMIVSWKGFNARHYDPRQQGGGANNMSYTQLKQYCRTDGTDQTWPEDLAEDEWATIADYSARLEEMEPRYWASAAPGGYDARNNEGTDGWRASDMVNYSTWEGKANIEQCGRRIKFWYHAGSRTWFDFPIYRLSYFYLALAEAENELGNTDAALKAVNVTRDRAGLPDIETRDREALRKAIQREDAVELYEENHRLFDVKHWKLQDIGNGIIGGPKKGFQFDYVTPSAGSYSLDNYKGYKVSVSYNAFWSDNQYLNPFPEGEVNKGYLVQNPGY